MDKSSFEVKKGVLVIDDMYEDYNHISSIFKVSGWEVFPDIDDYKSNWNQMYLNSEPPKISEFIKEYLKKKYREIAVIILDVWLARGEQSDQTGIVEILPMIRNLNEKDKEFMRWGEKVPLIIVTQIPSKEINRTSLVERGFVDVFFRKGRFYDEPHLLVITAQSLFSVFQMRSSGGLDGIIDDKIKAVLEYLERDKKAVISKVNDIEIILKGGMDSVETQIRLILNALFVQMEDDDKQKIMQEFSMGIKHALGDEQFRKIEQSLQKPTLKEDFKNCIKNGTKADFVEFLLRVFEDLSDSGALAGIPFVKFVGYGLNTVLKILSKG